MDAEVSSRHPSPYKEVGLSAKLYPKNKKSPRPLAVAAPESVKFRHDFDFEINTESQFHKCRKCGRSRFAVDFLKCRGRNAKI